MSLVLIAIADHCPAILPNFYPFKALKLSVQTIPPPAADIYRLPSHFSAFLENVRFQSTVSLSKATPAKILDNFVVRINDPIMDFKFLDALSSSKPDFRSVSSHTSTAIL